MSPSILKNRNGFTLVELMLCVSIVAVIMGVILFNYKGFNKNLVLSTAAQELAVDIRQAQSNSLSVKEGDPGAGRFDYSYGVALPMGGPTSPTYYFFVDRNSNGKFDDSGVCGGANECIEKITFRDGVEMLMPNDETNSPPATASSAQIMFLRPRPDAIITFYNSVGGLVKISGVIEIPLVVSGSVKTAAVSVFSGGQISVE